MGGTFDPIHVGHLILADQARERFCLERVIFVTAANPPHKVDEIVSDAQHRLKMTSLAVEDNKYFECSAIEMERSGPSYTIDTLRQLLGQFDGNIEICLLLGADEGRDFASWHKPAEICRLAKVVVANRPGMLVNEVIDSLPDELASEIVPLEMPGIDISSTDLRRRVREGESIHYLVPRVVEDYIWAKGLYK